MDMKTGQFSLGTSEGAVVVTDRIEPCTLRDGDEVLRVEGVEIVSLDHANASIRYLAAEGYGTARFEVARHQHIMIVLVAIRTDEDSLVKAERFVSIDRGIDIRV